MKSQLEFVKALFYNLHDEFINYMEGMKVGDCYMLSANWMNKNHGKTAIKRKITLLRQELLNLEQMLEE